MRAWSTVGRSTSVIVFVFRTLDPHQNRLLQKATLPPPATRHFVGHRGIPLTLSATVLVSVALVSFAAASFSRALSASTLCSSTRFLATVYHESGEQKVHVNGSLAYGRSVARS